MNPEITIGIPEIKNDLQQILKLQSENHISNFSPGNIPDDGFVTVKHDLQMLTQMNHAAKQIIAKDGEQVIGYALVMLHQFQDLLPVLIPMFELLKNISYNGKKLQQISYYVMGQVCIAKAYRGQGIFNKLYQKHKEIYSKAFECCVTEIATRNIHSMKAHERIGFKTIHTHTDETDEWNILLWDWK